MLENERYTNFSLEAYEQAFELWEEEKENYRFDPMNETYIQKGLIIKEGWVSWEKKKRL